MSGHTEALLAAAHENPHKEAIIWRGLTHSYGWLQEAIDGWRQKLLSKGAASGRVVALDADFSPDGVAALLANIDLGNIVVPLTSAVGAHREEFLAIAEVEVIATIQKGRTSIDETGRSACHPLLRRLVEQQHPGLILFSSGSTGKSKAAVHDFVPLLEKFHVRRKCRRMMAFLLFDHIGGLNTLLYALSNAGTLVTAEDRSPDAVAEAIERHRVEALPTTPTFLHLLLLSEAHRRHDLSSLQLITYGTEVMPQGTLERVYEAFPHVELQQTYGLSELGILRSKSKSAASLWMKIGGEGFETRIRNGVLEIRARSAMLGYLNAPSPFTHDGWFMTGDAVDVDGEYLRIHGRISDVINVGGEKVYPAEVETVLEALDGVEEAAVSSGPTALTGQMVVARVRLSTGESANEFRVRMRRFCQGKLAAYKIPQKVILSDSPIHGQRFKKLRR